MTQLSFFTSFYQHLGNHRFFPDMFMSAFRFSTRKAGNFLLPKYLKRTALRYALPIQKRDGRRIIVSFTSFPARIDYVWIIFECLVRQTILPDEVVLYLSCEQFPTMDDVPESLRSQMARGLKIELCKGDLRSHKKYYYAFHEYPNDFVITVDDDIFYDPHMIENLMRTHEKYPLDVIANKTRIIKLNNDGSLKPYSEWDYSYNEGRDSKNVQIGVGGVLYQPKLLYKDILRWDIACQLCPNADDLWLFAMTRLGGHEVVRTNRTSNMNLGIRGYAKKMALSSVNVAENMNDKQIKQIDQYYKKTLGYSLFSSV